MRRFGPSLAVAAAVLIGASATAFALRPVAELDESPLGGVDAAAAVLPAHACKPAPDGTTPAAALRVTRLFLWKAVLRREPACSYDLVTAEMRNGLTRRQWASGEIPVVAFPTETPSKVGLHLVSNSVEPLAEPHLATMFMILEAPDSGARAFKLMLVTRQGRWLVSHWSPIGPLERPSGSGSA